MFGEQVNLDTGLMSFQERSMCPSQFTFAKRRKHGCFERLKIEASPEIP